MAPVDSIWLQLGSALLLMILLFIWLRKSSTLLPELNKRAVLITGCDSGFGHELAKCLDKLGVTVFAGCLFPESVGATELKSVCSDQLQVLHLDVTREEHVKNAVETIKNSLGGRSLWAIVNNAGIGTIGEMEWMNIDTVKKVFDVNTFGPVRVTTAFLPLLRISRGRVVIVSSMTGRHALPCIGVYSMSKHAAVALADVLRFELKKWGITVHDIQPTFFRTNILDHGFIQKELESHWNKLSEEVCSAYGQKYLEDLQEDMLSLSGGKFVSPKIYQVVDDVLDAVIGKSPKNVYRPGLSSKLHHFVLLLLPQSVLTYFATSFLPKLQTNKT